MKCATARTLFTYPGIPSLKPKKARRPSGSVPPIHRPGYVFTLFSHIPPSVGAMGFETLSLFRRGLS